MRFAILLLVIVSCAKHERKSKEDIAREEARAHVLEALESLEDMDLDEEIDDIENLDEEEHEE
jgi:hypothetical protein